MSRWGIGLGLAGIVLAAVAAALGVGRHQAASAAPQLRRSPPRTLRNRPTTRPKLLTLSAPPGDAGPGKGGTMVLRTDPPPVALSGGVLRSLLGTTPGSVYADVTPGHPAIPDRAHIMVHWPTQVVTCSSEYTDGYMVCAPPAYLTIFLHPQQPGDRFLVDFAVSIYNRTEPFTVSMNAYGSPEYQIAPVERHVLFIWETRTTNAPGAKWTDSVKLWTKEDTWYFDRCTLTYLGGPE